MQTLARPTRRTIAKRSPAGRRASVRSSLSLVCVLLFLYGQRRLIVCSQNELGSNIYVAVSDVRDDVAKTHTVVAATHSVAVDTHTVVCDIRREIRGSREGADGQYQSVSDTRTIPTTKCMLTVIQNQTRSAESITSGSSALHLHPAYQVNRLPRRQGPVSDVTS